MTTKRDWALVSLMFVFAAESAYAVTFPPAISSTLNSRCFSCHGAGGQNDGGFGSILDADGLIQEHKIVPGDPELSPLFLMVQVDAQGRSQMPPAGPTLAAAEIERIRAWISSLPPTGGGGSGGGGSSLPIIYPLSSLQRRATTAEVVERHAGPKRDGHFVAPTFGLDAIPNLKLVSTFSPAMVGQIYAQPLYVEKAIDGKDILLVATEANHVYALDAGTGQIVWDRALGKPVPHSDMPCGNIDPLGITGTPVVDTASGSVVLDAMEYTTSNPPLKRHILHRLSLKDGSEVAGWGFDVAEKLRAKDPALVFNSEYENERGALALVGGMVYVPYGGHWGDCGDYRGWVVGVPLASTAPADLRAWKTLAPLGGSWAPGGVASADGAIFFTTGNTQGATDWGGGEAIIRVPPDLSFSKDPAFFFSPANWKELDTFDIDVGGVAPVLIDLPQGATQKLAVTFGKDGFIYVIDRNRPGGIGGALVAKKIARTVITVPAAYSTQTGTYVVVKGTGQSCPAGQKGDLTAVRISPTLEVTTAWCANQGGMASPIVTTTDGRTNAVVWGLGAEGNGALHAFNGETGAEIALSATLPRMPGIVRYQSPIVAKDRLYVAARGKIHVFATGSVRLRAGQKKQQ